MVKVIVIRDLKDITETSIVLNRIKKRLPNMTSDTMMQWGKMLEKSMINSAKQAGIKKFTGGLFQKGIEWRQKPRGKKGELFIRLHGVYLDSMKPHFVNVKRSRTTLLSWALQANNAKLQARAQQVKDRKIKSFPIYVKQKPFIRRGYKRARGRLKPMLNRALELAVNTA